MFGFGGFGRTPKILRYDWLPASAIQGAGVQPATLVLLGCSVAWQFADNLEKEIQLALKTPETGNDYKPLIICVGWSSAAVNKKADIEIDYLITGANDNTLAACTTLQSLENSSSVSNGMVISYFEIPAIEWNDTDMCLHMTIRRNGNDAQDTLSDTMEVHGVALGYYPK